MIITTFSTTDAEQLSALVATRGKHGDYQLLHPWLEGAVAPGYRPAGKHEAARQAFMRARLPLQGLRVLDIGANTGYFSFGALEAGAAHVTAFEGHRAHAAFVAQAARALGLADRLTVHHDLFDFQRPLRARVDVALCLNVLHHLGDDFGPRPEGRDAALAAMARALAALAGTADRCWFQLGFNWKGDRRLPLFEHGTKAELIGFVEQACAGVWALDAVALYDPSCGAYADRCDALMARRDELGEFLNRPLFLLRRRRPA
jgi:SAM-dependent methyltransferase